MDHRIKILIEALEGNGWSFAGPADMQSDWWFKDMYLLVSNWRPVGTKLYLTVLIDPGDNNYKEVWAAGFSKEIPNGKNFTYLKQLTLKDISRTDMVALTKELNELALT